MTSLIDNLYKEYKELYEKLTKVGDLIVLYGGRIPSLPGHKHSEAILGAAFDDIVSYPSTGTWKEKIIFALKEAGKPSTVGELSDIIHKYQPKTDLQAIVNALTQTCSTMAADGKIAVEKGYRNKYSYAIAA